MASLASVRRPLTSASRRRTGSGTLVGGEADDPYRSKTLRTFLQDYKRVSIRTACEETSDVPVDLDKLIVWVNRAGRWEKIDADVQFRNSKASICRDMVTKVFGLSGRQYDAIRDALDDVDSGDLMGIYRHDSVPGQFAIVLRLPVATFSNLKLGGAAGAGVVLGAAGMWATSQKRNKIDRPPTQDEIEERWRDAYLLYMMKSQQLLQTYLEVTKKLNVANSTYDYLFPNYQEDTRKMFNQWYLVPDERKNMRASSMAQLRKTPPKGASLVERESHKLLPVISTAYQGRGKSVEQLFVSNLLSSLLDQQFNNLGESWASTAHDVVDDYNILIRNEEWKEGEAE